MLVCVVTTCSELWKVLFWRHLSVCFCLCMKYLWNCWMDLSQIHMEDVFGPSVRWVWRSRSPGTKNGFFGPFGSLRVGETSLASSHTFFYIYVRVFFYSCSCKLQLYTCIFSILAQRVFIFMHFFLFVMATLPHNKFIDVNSMQKCLTRKQQAPQTRRHQVG